MNMIYMYQSSTHEPNECLGFQKRNDLNDTDNKSILQSEIQDVTCIICMYLNVQISRTL